MTKASFNDLLNSLNLSEVYFNNCNVEWKTQESNENSILFYNLDESDSKQIELAKERIASAKFKICFIKGSVKFEDAKVISLESSLYRETQESILNILYPFDEKTFIGITGTNGKTTTVDLIRQICLKKNINIMTIGTLGVLLNDKTVENFNLTSPSYIDLRKTIHKYNEKFDVLAMELSSIALEQNRIGSLSFDSIGWTNFTQDHLDYHGDMEEYFRCKTLVFESLKENGKVYIPETQVDIINKIEKKNKIQAVGLNTKTKNPFFQVAYNKENLAVAISCLNNFEDVTDEIVEGLCSPPGRFNIINYQDSFIVIDYAHTPDAVESICRELRTSFSDKNLITIFGCGGDRDRTKRPLMAEAAAKNSDYVILTSDNPRFEEPMQILEDAKVGLSGSYELILDRKEAITKGIKLLNNSILLIAGKGHEDYLDIKGKKLPYSDHDTVMGIIND